MDVDSFCEEMRNANTAYQTNSHLKLFQEFILLRYKDRRHMECIPISQLDECIASFLINVRQKNGTEYEPSTLRTMQSSFDRHLRENKYGHVIARSHLFDKTQRAMKSKATNLKVSV